MRLPVRADAGHEDHSAGFLAGPLYSRIKLAEVAARREPWCDVPRDFPSTGERQIIVRLTYPGIPAGAAAESVELFGREIAPRLNPRGATV